MKLKNYYYTYNSTLYSMPSIVQILDNMTCADPPAKTMLTFFWL